ncbi:MAG: hypothetical protein IJY09_01285 [Lachnospiraceae bacterium]|nr:hypothetical protein [Lachnospiraceae bacterium]
MIRNFADFCEELQQCGFSMGGGNAKGIFALIDYDWQAPENATMPIKWHTGDPETDPWQWRIRVLTERKDIAYAKVFFGTSGYITREWYPYFLAVRRGEREFEDFYETGKVSVLEKDIYELIRTNGKVPLHLLKQDCGITKETSGKFDRVLTNLQRNLFVTMCGTAPRVSKNGEVYGWDSTVFCTVEEFWGADLRQDISMEKAYVRIREQIFKLNPQAEEKNIKKFILD